MWWPVPTLLFGWKRGVWRGCGGFLSVRFTICAIYLEDLLQAVPFSNQLGVMANIPGSGFQAFDDARLDPSMVVRVIVHISICVSFCKVLTWLLGFPSSLPVHRSVSERIERKCRCLGIRTTFKSKGTLREALVQTKDP